MRPAYALALAAGVSYAAVAADLPEVRVRLKRAQASITVSGFELSIAPPNRFATKVSLAPLSIQSAVVRAVGRGRWEVSWADQSEVQELQGERLWIKGRSLHLGREAAPFELEVFSSGRTHLDVVAHLDMEKYLMGVLPSEMPIEWPLEALKAQTVAARSFALRQARERRGLHYDLDANITDQVYRFVAESRRHPARVTKVARAVRETQGEVLLESTGRVLKAFYSADCGCTTEDSRYVWGGNDGLPSVLDPTCGMRQPAKWHRKLKREEVRRKLTWALKLPAGSTLDKFEIGGRTPSGRVASVTADMSTNGSSHHRQMNVNEFRKTFGFRRIRSANFSLKWTEDELMIAGTGLGHGVGMCQTGARALADQGSSYKKILKLYYPKAEIGLRERI